jgi:hypothetical protein
VISRIVRGYELETPLAARRVMFLAASARASIHEGNPSAKSELELDEIYNEDYHPDNSVDLRSRPWLVNQRPCSSNYDVSPPGSDFEPDKNEKEGMVKEGLLSCPFEDPPSRVLNVAPFNGRSRASSCPVLMGSPTMWDHGVWGTWFEGDPSSVIINEVPSPGQDDSVHTESPEEPITGTQTQVHGSMPVSVFAQMIRRLIRSKPGTFHEELAEYLDGPEEALPERQRALCKLKGVPYLAGRSAYRACNPPIPPSDKPLSSAQLPRNLQKAPHIHRKFSILKQLKFPLDPQLIPKTASHAIGNDITLAGGIALVGGIEEHLTVEEAEQALLILEEEHRYYADKETEARKKAGELRAFTCLDNSEDWRHTKDKKAEKAAEDFWTGRAKIFGSWREMWESKISDVKGIVDKLRLVGKNSEDHMSSAGIAAEPQKAVIDWA